MNCKCAVANSLYACSDAIIIGTADISTDYIVFFKDTITGRILKFPTASDGSGLIRLELSHTFTSGVTYELWVTTTILDEKVIISAGESQFTCIEINFNTTDCCLPEQILSVATASPFLSAKSCLCIKATDSPDWGQTNSILFSFVKRKSVAVTVPQLQALVAAANLNPDMWYIVVGVQGGFGDLRIRARNVANLEVKGTLIKNNLSYEAAYNLPTDEIIEIYDPRLNNRLSRPVGSGFTNIDNFSYSSGWYGNTLTDCDLFITNAGNCTMRECAVTGGSITLDGTNGTVSISDSRAEASTIILSSIVSGNTQMSCCDHVGSNISVTDGGELSFSKTLSAGININSTTVYGDFRFCNVTFPTNSGSYPSCELHTGTTAGVGYSNIVESHVVSNGNFDFTIAGFNRSYVGKIQASAPFPVSITSFTNFDNTFKHPVEWNGFVNQLTFVHDGINIFCNGGVNAILSSPNDFIKFKYVGNVAFEVARGIY